MSNLAKRENQLTVCDPSRVGAFRISPMFRIRERRCRYANRVALYKKPRPCAYPNVVYNSLGWGIMYTEPSRLHSYWSDKKVDMVTTTAKMIQANSRKIVHLNTKYVLNV